MKTKKLREDLQLIEGQSSDSSDMSKEDLGDSFGEEKRKKGKKIMPSHSKERMVPKKHKGLKSKNKKVVSDESKKKKSVAHKRTRYTDVYDDIESKFCVMERAERVLSCLENDLPHFIKCMLPSNVAHGFWLHLPKKFCSMHLPNHDSSVVLVDEWGNEYKTSYLLERHGLSAGWRGFSISHRLIKGDILIFHLMEQCKLKVRIVRVNGSDVVNAALCLMSMDPTTRDADSDNLEKKVKGKRKKTSYVEPFMLEAPKPSESTTGKDTPSSTLKPTSNQSSRNSDGLGSEAHEGVEVTTQPQSIDIRCPETSFLPDHSHKGVTCM